MPVNAVFRMKDRFSLCLSNRGHALVVERYHMRAPAADLCATKDHCGFPCLETVVKELRTIENHTSLSVKRARPSRGNPDPWCISVPLIQRPP